MEHILIGFQLTINYPQSWEKPLSGKKPAWPPCSLPVPRPLKSSEIWTRGETSEKDEVQYFMTTVDLFSPLQYPFIRERKNLKS